ncbi:MULTISPECIES: RdgB/HAM1 family non-canonical purine NTP pyrophosphatase [unclassified Francisella]|uniref:RdgB/HAM1 family non-canonical purine NTP pyrophosphatase n=1 Tax=unclassified Francisella TaxID=2610885 RepID=UPI002E309E29|nr:MULTISPECIES: RdgB/HAM1 family non-canonical purine NTP pyrophosphatase [unclassified Francisella]MED7819428.1 RdgB/HAM1 family non-canonical purine NTP pyrophosphatase [Francisella sp. 19S2-4]MED7830217.1 RdgB/HAM1 family non-canonical purine NTP pyrophosphatase [Francisella sp. 19S2-10]
MKKIVLASSNKGKIKEFKEIFANINIEIIPQTDFHVSDIDETGLSFIENAILKARNCSKHTGLPAIADDSGLEVFSLNGEPGIYSARYSGEHGNDKANIDKLLTKMNSKTSRAARFVCALAHVKHAQDPTPTISLGFLNGEIADIPKGGYGFGYDPIFKIPEFKKTLAEISPEDKNKISHRAIALNNIIKNLT